jgi:hypothetical protein
MIPIDMPYFTCIHGSVNLVRILLLLIMLAFLVQTCDNNSNINGDTVSGLVPY